MGSVPGGPPGAAGGADSYFVPLQQSLRKARRHREGSFGRLRSKAMGFFFLDRVQYKNILVWIATYHYVPLHACILAILANCIFHIFFHLVFPLMQDVHAWSMAQVGEGHNVEYAHNVPAALYLVATHMGLLLGIGIVGYKLLGAVTDAMIDSCLVVHDDATSFSVGFFGLLNDYRKIHRSGFSRLVFTATTLLLLGGLLVIFFGNWLVTWEPNDGNVFWLSVVLLALSGVYQVRSYHRSVMSRGNCTEGESARDVTLWWRKEVPRTRRFCLNAIIVWSAMFALRRNATYGICCFCEGVLHINLVHLVLVCSAKMTLFLIKLRSSVQEIIAAPHARRLFGILVLPWLALAVSTVFSFPLLMAILHLPPVLLLLNSLSSSIRRAREERDAASGAASGHAHSHDEGQPRPPSRRLRETDDAGTAHSSRRRRPPRASVETAANARSGPSDRLQFFPSLWDIASRLYLCQRRSSTRNPKHYELSLLFRSVHRIFITATVVLMLFLGIWVSVLNPSLDRPSPTTCTSDLSGNRIQVHARYMVAELYGLSDFPSDPRSLVYEEDHSIYDTRRSEGLCSRLWGELHAGDLSYFSLMAYLSRNSTDFSSMLNFYRRFRQGASDWVALPTNHSYGSAHFLHLYSASKNTSVIAVRGTDVSEPFDFLQNILLFGETAIFQMLSVVLPLSSFIPERVIVDFVAAANAISSTVIGLDPRRHYYHLHIEEYLKNVASNRVIITGHSLGGVIAQIVASRLGIEGIGFSSPGINLMRKKLGIRPDNIDAYTTTVIVSNDFTVAIDKPGGSVHHIQCEHKTAEVCHSIELHTIRMWTVCQQYRALTRLNGTYHLTN